MPFTTVISVAELAAHLHDASWVVCDCRHDLVDTGAGKRAHGELHIPGARFVHLDDDLSAPVTGRNGRHPLPEPERLARRAGEVGGDVRGEGAMADGGAQNPAADVLLRSPRSQPRRRSR